MAERERRQRRVEELDVGALRVRVGQQRELPADIAMHREDVVGDRDVAAFERVPPGDRPRGFAPDGRLDGIGDGLAVVRRVVRDDAIAEAEKAEKVWPTPLQALLFAERCAVLSGDDSDFVLNLTMFYTGARWSEVMGLVPGRRCADRFWFCAGIPSPRD